MTQGMTIQAVLEKAERGSSCLQDTKEMLDFYIEDALADVIKEGGFPAKLTYPNDFYERLAVYLYLQDFDRDFRGAIFEFLQDAQKGVAK